MEHGRVAAPRGARCTEQRSQADTERCDRAAVRGLLRLRWCVALAANGGRLGRRREHVRQAGSHCERDCQWPSLGCLEWTSRGEWCRCAARTVRAGSGTGLSRESSVWFTTGWGGLSKPTTPVHGFLLWLRVLYWWLFPMNMKNAPPTPDVRSFAGARFLLLAISPLSVVTHSGCFQLRNPAARFAALRLPGNTSSRLPAQPNVPASSPT